jgi:hypothetical protein
MSKTVRSFIDYSVPQKARTVERETLRIDPGMPALAIAIIGPGPDPETYQPLSCYGMPLENTTDPCGEEEGWVL